MYNINRTNGSDIDECLDSALNNCSSSRHERCHNTQGSFKCVCNESEGFELDELSGTCEGR